MSMFLSLHGEYVAPPPDPVLPLIATSRRCGRGRALCGEGGAGQPLPDRVPALAELPTAVGDGGPMRELNELELVNDKSPIEAGVGGGAAGPLAGVANALEFPLNGLPSPTSRPIPEMEVVDAGVSGGVSGVCGCDGLSGVCCCP